MEHLLPGPASEPINRPRHAWYQPCNHLEQRPKGSTSPSPHLGPGALPQASYPFPPHHLTHSLPIPLHPIILPIPSNLPSVLFRVGPGQSPHRAGHLSIPISASIPWRSPFWSLLLTSSGTLLIFCPFGPCPRHLIFPPSLAGVGPDGLPRAQTKPSALWSHQQGSKTGGRPCSHVCRTRLPDHWWAPDWPGARKPAVPFVLWGSWKGKTHLCKALAVGQRQKGLLEVWDRREDCSVIRQRAEEARDGFPGPRWALQPASSPSPQKEANKHRCRQGRLGWGGR